MVITPQQIKKGKSTATAAAILQAKKAMFNARKIDQVFVFDGDQVAIDGESVTYESLCPACYFRESNK